MKPIASLLLIMAWLSVAAPAGSGVPGTYLPLEAGNRWAYTGELVGPDIKEVASGADPQFYNSFPIIYDVSDHSLGLRNYWSTNDDGDVFLHGFARLSPRISRFYEPPLKVVDGPLVPGRTWTSAISVVEFPGGPAIGAFEIQYTTTDPVVVVIAGESYHAHGVLESLATISVAGIGSEWTTDGRPFDLAKEGDVIVPHWWVEGIGEVRYRSIGIFDLVDFFIQGAVGNDDMSWSELKKGYR